MQDLRRASGQYPFGAHIVLDGNRDAAERLAISGRNSPVRFLGPYKRFLSCQGDIGLDFLFHRIDPRKDRFGYLPRLDFPLSEKRRQLGYAEPEEFQEKPP